jgi:hypothetical protein
MIALNLTDPVAIQLGSIGYPCGPVLMILNRMIGLCGVLKISSSPAAGCEFQTFKAIDQNKQGVGYIFTFHPDTLETAQDRTSWTASIPTERPKRRGSGQISSCSKRQTKLLWKVKGKSVVSVDDLEIECITDLDEDKRIMDRNQQCETAESDPPRLMRDKMDDETISTMNGLINKHRHLDTGGNSKGPPSKLALQEDDTLAGSKGSSMLPWT